MTLENVVASLGKPLPTIFPFAEGFWEGLRRAELRVQKCSKCNHAQLYPRTNCEECGSRGLSWSKTSGFGTVYSYTVIRQVVKNSPAFEKEVPYALCIIELDERVRIVAQVVECPPENVKVGMRVAAFFEDIGGGVSIVKFRPV
jgi:uncharacterized OB-fold protein